MEARRDRVYGGNSNVFRRFIRYVVLIISAAVVTCFFFFLAPRRSILEQLSMATAYASVILLALALSMGPVNVLRGKPNPLSSYLRRDIGIVGGLVALVHVVLGLQVHMGGDFVQYFFRRVHHGHWALRLDAFGITNHFGLIATLIFLVLLAISSNAAMRQLGPHRWKTIQRSTYVAAFLVIVHGLIYQALEEQKLVLIILIVAIALAVSALQGTGFFRRKSFEVPAGSVRAQGMKDDT
jgi:sulfoxide reductase heme-binding subunit YedZ